MLTRRQAVATLVPIQTHPCLMPVLSAAPRQAMRQTLTPLPVSATDHSRAPVTTATRMERETPTHPLGTTPGCLWVNVKITAIDSRSQKIAPWLEQPAVAAQVSAPYMILDVPSGKGRIKRSRRVGVAGRGMVSGMDTGKDGGRDNALDRSSRNNHLGYNRAVNGLLRPQPACLLSPLLRHLQAAEE